MNALLTNPVHELDFDGIDLTGRTDYGGFRYVALGEGSTLGNPQPLDREIASALLDGGVVVTESHGNREPRFQIHIEADNSALLAVAESKLFRSCSKRVLLGWKPPDGWGPRTLFQAFTSRLDYAFDDLRELRLVRAYSLTLSCAPFGFSTEQVAVVATAAPPVSPVTTVISDGTSATGWSSPSTASAQPTVASGQLRIAPREELYLNAQYGWVCEATKTLSAVNFSTAPFISVDIKPRALMRGFTIPENATNITQDPDDGTLYGYESEAEENPLNWVAAYVDGVKLPVKNFTTLPDGQTIRYTFTATDASASAFRLLFGTAVVVDGDDYHPTGAAAGITIDNLSYSNVAPGQSSSGRMTSLSFDVQGSARSAASIEVSHATAGLGEVLLYTSSALGQLGYEPQCRQYLAGGVTTTTDSTMLSGARTRCTAGGNMEWNIPASVIPAGAYQVAVRKRWIKQSSGGVDTYLTATVSMKIGSTLYSSTTLPARPVLTAATSSGTKAWDPIFTFGVVHLPPQDVPAGGTVGYINVKLQETNQAGGVTDEHDFDVDDLFLFKMGDDSDISHVQCGSGTPAVGTVHNRVFMDQPSPSNPRYHFYVGTQADRSDAFDPGYPSVTARGSHPIAPGANRLWAASTGAAYPIITYRYFPAWHTHAGPVTA